VCVGDRAFVGPQAVIRADEPGADGTVHPIVLGECVNVQDGAVIHAVGGTGVSIGPRTSIAHAAVIHGPCTIGAGCFVGFNSVVYRATLGDGVVVMHHALVEGTVVPEGLYVPSITPVRCERDVARLGRVAPDVVAFVERVSRTNVLLAEAALRGEANP
jgi:carbonic anhydrase/acetyltransferase-like protein (isoleucine patch superfamily)